MLLIDIHIGEDLLSMLTDIPVKQLLGSVRVGGMMDLVMIITLVTPVQFMDGCRDITVL